MDLNGHIDITGAQTLAMYIAIGANGSLKTNDVDLEPVNGHLGLMVMLAEIAQKATLYIKVTYGEKDAPGVLEYELGEEFGHFAVENIDLSQEDLEEHFRLMIDNWYNDKTTSF